MSYREIYEPPPVASLLSDQPRFGKTKDFTALFSDDKEERKDYLVGLIFGGALTLGIFLAWMIVLLVLKFLGNRVGFLSGQAFVRAPPPFAPGYDDNHDLKLTVSDLTSDSRSDGGHEVWMDEISPKKETTQLERTKATRRPTIVRCIFLLSGMIFIAFSVLMVTQGFANIQRTYSTLHNSAVAVHDIAAEVENIHDENIVSTDLEQSATEARDALVAEFTDTSKFCPGDPDMQNSQAVRDVAEQASDAVDLLAGLGSFLSEQTDNVKYLSQQVQAGSEQVQNATDTGIQDWKVLLFLTLCVLTPTCLIFGTILALLDIDIPYYPFIANWVFLPIFILIVVVCALVQGVTMIAAGMNADFCLPGGEPSPDMTVKTIVQRAGYAPDTYVYQGFDWYVSQCDETGTVDPFQPLVDYQPSLEASQDKLDALAASFFEDEEVLSELSLLCGRDFSDLEETVKQMKGLLATLRDTLQRILDLFACPDIAAIYTATVYDGTCTYSMEAVFWIYCSTLVMAVFGMLMITLRASYLKTEEPYIASVAADVTAATDSEMLRDENVVVASTFNGVKRASNAPYREHYNGRSGTYSDGRGREFTLK